MKQYLHLIAFVLLLIYIKLIYSIYWQNMSEVAGSRNENFFKYRNSVDLNTTELDLPDREANDNRQTSNTLTGIEVRQIATLVKEFITDKLVDADGKLQDEYASKIWNVTTAPLVDFESYRI